MYFRPMNRQHVAAIVRKLAYANATPERSAELLAALRRYNPHDVAALFEPPPPQVWQPPPRPQVKSKYVTDHKNPYREGGRGLKAKVLQAVFASKICPVCRRAFLSRRRDAKTCSAKCRTALHRKSK
jgi:hypothetical protein